MRDETETETETPTPIVDPERRAELRAAYVRGARDFYGKMLFYRDGSHAIERKAAETFPGPMVPRLLYAERWPGMGHMWWRIGGRNREELEWARATDDGTPPTNPCAWSVADMGAFAAQAGRYDPGFLRALAELVERPMKPADEVETGPARPHTTEEAPCRG